MAFDDDPVVVSIVSDDVMREMHLGDAYVRAPGPGRFTYRLTVVRIRESHKAMDTRPLIGLKCSLSKANDEYLSPNRRTHRGAPRSAI